jgi:uncharacterized tellurite resistance protein B-like protein
VVTEAIRELLAKRPAPAPGANPPFALDELAAAALMVECARIDGEFTNEERDAICRAVREALGLDQETAECLVGVAEMREDEVWDDWLFTETVKSNFSEQERRAVIGRLWEVALADGRLHPIEERMIGRIARELGVSKEEVAAIHSSALERGKGKTDPRA